LTWEREAIVVLAEDWGEVDRSHRTLARRGSRLERVYVSESTVLRVLDTAVQRRQAAPDAIASTAAGSGTGLVSRRCRKPLA
jgi:putative transposase